MAYQYAMGKQIDDKTFSVWIYGIEDRGMVKVTGPGTFQATRPDGTTKEFVNRTDRLINLKSDLDVFYSAVRWAVVGNSDLSFFGFAKAIREAI